ncbi:unnamed protein product [Periconia digitata]|uniref:Tat pathway signal sequence protein n=1 Tax=Periconia digitata TaxID=1303443 RepID=A0A9W4XGH0_9PLEO|nr:unnamed protein product [Periconia digitata]
MHCYSYVTSLPSIFFSTFRILLLLDIAKMNVENHYHRLSQNDNDIESCTASDQHEDSASRTRKKLSQFYFIFVHLILVIAILHMCVTYPRWHRSKPDEYIYMAEALAEITEERTDTHSHSAFTGTPNNANTKAWEDLLLPGFFNATAEEITSVGASIDESVKVDDGGYLASLHVYHDIHCLRRLRLWLYRDHFYPHIDPTRVPDIQRHLGKCSPTMFKHALTMEDHCIETLRRNTMCKADTSVDTFVWTDPTAEKPAMKSTGFRKCVNWDKFESWAFSRKIDLHPYILRPTEDKKF